MSFLLPEPEIELYETSFPENDPLGREPEGRKLSRLVESISQPMVIALDGGWGSGKTVFLKYWVGYHTKKHPDTKCVYFDAFANDFMDSPLTGLIAELVTRFPKEPTNNGVLAALQNNAGKIALSGVRIGLAAFTAGASERIIGDADSVLDDAAAKGVAAASKELEKAADAFLKTEEVQRSAMKVFRDTLVALTEPTDDGVPQKRLIFVVDELDRCRPDYALSVLETIKHFFAIPGVHFILGTNMEGLAASVNARYGQGHQSRKYLTKFVDVTFNLSPSIPDTEQQKRQSEVIMFDHFVDICNLSDPLAHQLRIYLSHLAETYRLEFREVRRLVLHGKLIEAQTSDMSEKWNTVVAGVLIMKAAIPTMYSAFLDDGPMQPTLREILRKGAQRERILRVWTQFNAGAGSIPDFARDKEVNRQKAIKIITAFNAENA